MFCLLTNMFLCMVGGTNKGSTLYDVEYHTAYSNPGFIAKLQAMGVKVALWTVDTEKAVRSLLPLGPDCIVTNRPDRVREWVEENQ